MLFPEKKISCMTALIYAAENGHLQCMDNLTQAGADVNAMKESGYTALHWVCRYGFTECLELLIQQGADVNNVFESGFAPLRSIVVGFVDDGKVRCMQLLFQAGTHVNVSWEGKNVITQYFTRAGRVNRRGVLLPYYF